MEKSEIKKNIKGKLAAAGFHLSGFAPAGKLEKSALLNKWLKGGNHGAMQWMENYLDKRLNIMEYFPEARSVIIIAHNYFTDYQHSSSKVTGKISRYAWGRDYHKIIKKKLKNVLKEMGNLLPEIKGRLFVDTAPVQEKLWAQQTGIGWQGKHTNIISPEYGSWIFLGGLVINIELDYDQPAADHCGNCTACIDACPTGALKPYVLDARRCISYLTIENKEEKIPLEFHDKTENWIFGCDICQDVCPWNRKIPATNESQYFPQVENITPDLHQLSEISEDEFRKRFAKSAVLRAKHKYFIRNVKTILELRRIVWVTQTFLFFVVSNHTS